MAGLLIRQYQHGDLNVCRELWADLTQHHRDLYRDPSIGGEAPGLHFDRHLERVGPQHIWVAELDGRVVGFAGLILYDSEAELEPIVVSNGCRSRGVGQALVERVIAEARLSGVRYLSVRPVARNLAAIRFFYRQGFQLLGQPEFFMDLKPPAVDPWQPGPEVFGCSFRV